MFATLGRSLRKRRRGLTIAAGIVGGSYMIYTYAKTKLQDMQQRMAAERTAKDNLQKRFRQNQVDCLLTILALLPVVGDQVVETWNVEAVTERLKRARQAGGNAAGGLLQPALREDGAMADSMSSVLSSGDIAPTASPGETTGSSAPLDKKTKMELWNELKISTFTRTVSLLYLISLLAMLTHVQLNIVGRFSYIASVVAMARESRSSVIGVEDDLDKARAPEEEDFSQSLGMIGKVLGLSGWSMSPAQETPDEAPSSGREISGLTERRYLSFSWWLLQQSWKELVAKVHDSVVETMGPISLKKMMTFEDVGATLDALRASIEGQTGSTYHLLDLLLPQTLEQEMSLLDQAGLPLFEHQGGATVVDGLLELDALGRLDPELRRLLDESHDHLESEDGAYVFRKILDTAFEVLRGQLAPSFGIAPPDETGSASDQIQEIREPVEMKLASLFPVMNRIGQMAIHANPNDFVEAIGELKELQGFSAIIYSSYDKDALRA